MKYELIPSLEKEDGSVLICLHETLTLAQSMTEDTINCIEKSYKSIFVLSPSFVRLNGAIIDPTLLTAISSMKVLIT